MRHTILRLFGVLVVCALLAAAVAGPATAQAPAAKEVGAAVAERKARGLPAGRAHVEGLLRSLDNTASEMYGYPLTNAEYKGLLDRSRYVSRFQSKTLPHARKLDGYGGHWVDRQTGEIVVGLTNANKTAKDKVRKQLPKENYGVRFVEVKHSAAALNSALDRSDQAWASLGSGFEPQAYGVRFRVNRLVVKVLDSQLAKARQLKDRYERDVGVDVKIEATTRVVDSGCATRHKCFDPLRLGARMNYPNVYDSSNPVTQWNCAIGFMLSNERILTAGHCTYQRGTPWHGHKKYKDNYGKIGSKKSTRYTTKNRDLALISLEDWDANKSSRVFGAPWPHGLTQEGQTSENMDVCVSLARQDKYWCGYVNDSSNKWNSSGADITVWGASMKFNKSGHTSKKGDSGGPVVQPNGCGLCQDPLLRPIGIVNSGNEADNTVPGQTNGDLYFAKVQWALNNEDGWPSLSIYTGG